MCFQTHFYLLTLIRSQIDIEVFLLVRKIRMLNSFLLWFWRTFSYCGLCFSWCNKDLTLSWQWTTLIVPFAAAASSPCAFSHSRKRWDEGFQIFFLSATEGFDSQKLRKRCLVLYQIHWNLWPTSRRKLQKSQAQPYVTAKGGGSLMLLIPPLTLLK